MNGFSYAQVVSMVTYYLEQYPHVGVALECVLESVEGDGKMAGQVLAALDRVNAGEGDSVVLADWATQTGSRDLAVLAQRIDEARAKGQDIGLYVKKFMPGATSNQRRENNGNRNNNRNHRNGQGNGRNGNNRGNYNRNKGNGNGNKNFNKQPRS